MLRVGVDRRLPSNSATLLLVQEYIFVFEEYEYIYAHASCSSRVHAHAVPERRRAVQGARDGGALAARALRAARRARHGRRPREHRARATQPRPLRMQLHLQLLFPIWNLIVQYVSSTRTLLVPYAFGTFMRTVRTS